MGTLAERMDGYQQKREVYLNIEREHGENIPVKRAFELMQEAGFELTPSWINFIRKNLRQERGTFVPRGPNKKKIKSQQQVLLPEKDAFQTAVALVLRAMKARSIKKTTVFDDGSVQIESVETFSI